MQIGYKTGPRTWQESKSIILDHNIKYLEVWYRYDQPEMYHEVFDFLQQYQINFGLHYWGVVKDNILPSFCYDEPSQYRAGIESVKQAIDAAAAAGAYYVNIHPGCRVLTRLDDAFRHLSIIDGNETTKERGLELLLEAAAEMHRYAQNHNVIFTIETVPARDQNDWHSDKGRLHTLETKHASLDMVSRLASDGCFIANDFGHTAAALTGTEDIAVMWDELWRVSQDLASQTKLLHVNTISRPFNGTDSHDGILAEDWQQDVFPNEDQLLQLLRLFKDRDDVWAIPEPKEGLMLENYLALKRYAEKL